MTTARCPACGASVALGAPWCTLCYTDLRPREAPPATPAEPASVAVGASGAERVVGGVDRPYDALGVRPAEPLPAGAVLPPDPHLDAPVLKSADVALAAPGWPCRSCGSHVDLEADVCPQCHSPFLASEDLIELTLPGVGSVRKLDSTARTFVGIGGALLTTILLVVLAFLAGAIL